DDGGKTFKSLSDRPVTTLNDKKPGSPTGSILYVDSLADNETQYQYRVAGLSLFGDTGPYSNILKGKGKSVVNLTPHITSVTQTETGKYHLNWELPDTLNHLVKEFRINHS